MIAAPDLPPTMIRPAARPQGAMLVVVFATSTLALLLVGGWIYLQSMMAIGLALPLLLAILPAFAVSGLLLAWQLPAGPSRRLVCASLLFIDLGFGALTPVTLGLKLVAYIVALLLGVKALWSRGRPPLGGAVRLFLVYALFAWAGVAYGIEPFTTATTSFALLALALVAVWCTQLDPEGMRSTLRTLASFLGVAMILSGLFYVAVPSLAVAQNVAGEGRVSGLFGSPNTAGGVAALAVLLNLWRCVDAGERARGGLSVRLLFVLAGLAMLALSGSRTALLSLLVALAALGAMNLPRLTAVVVVALVTAGTAMVMFDWTDDVWRAVTGLLSRRRSGSDVSNLTGRLQIWRVVISEWERSPWIGYGLAGGRTLIAEGWSTVGGKTTGTAHNAVLESLLAVGVVGTSLLLGAVLMAVRDLVGAFRGDRAVRKVTEALVVLLLFVIAFGMTEKSYGGTPSLSTGVLALVIGMGVAVRRARLAGAQACPVGSRPSPR